MQKVVKKIVLNVILNIILFGGIPLVSAASGIAFTVGATLGSAAEDTTSFATYVRNQLDAMGYDAVARTGPTFSNILMEIPGISPKRWWLEADILYFAGHGSWDNVSLTTTGRTGPEYNIKITNTDSWQYGPDWGYIGIGWADASKTKFAMFQGCNTANQSYSNNIAAYARNQGIGTTLGWKSTIWRNAAGDWQNRFWPRVVAGDSIQQAIDYANSFYYSQASIKETKVYGSNNVIINSNSLSLVKVSNNLNEKNNDSREYIINKNIDNSTDSSKKTSIASLIKNNINKNFFSSDYDVKISKSEFNDEITMIYDFVLIINGVETNLAYTVFANEDSSKVTKIYDNTQNIDVFSAKENGKSIIALNKEQQEKIKSVKSAILSKNIIGYFKRPIDYTSIRNFYAGVSYFSDDIYYDVGYNYEIIGERKFYDAVKNKLYYIVDVESKMEDSNNIMIYSEFIEIS